MYRHDCQRQYFAVNFKSDEIQWYLDGVLCKVAGQLVDIPTRS